MRGVAGAPRPHAVCLPHVAPLGMLQRVLLEVRPSTRAVDVADKIAAAPIKLLKQKLHIPSQGHFYMEPQTAVAVSACTPGRAA